MLEEADCENQGKKSTKNFKQGFIYTQLEPFAEVKGLDYFVYFIPH